MMVVAHLAGWGWTSYVTVGWGASVAVRQEVDPALADHLPLPVVALEEDRSPVAVVESCAGQLL